MEDRYLYRAKRADNGEWVEGFYVNAIEEHGNGERTAEIVALDAIRTFNGISPTLMVDASTICQCTGLKDKNGKLIWENDIIKFEDCGEEGYEYKEGFDFINRARVEFAEGRWSLTDFASDNSYVMSEMYDHAEFMELWKECEVIGSVIDNPELLEVGE